MGGDIAQWNADITTDDNFHVVSDTHPVHLPTITNKCDGVTACTLDTITVTENYYDILNQFDTGESPIGAYEQKHKIKSRQAVQEAASGKDADFHETDEVGNRCGDINQESLNWALANASPEALERYNSVGKKLVIGDDKGPYNAGPLWIWTYMAYKDNKDKTETLVQSPMMRTPTNYFIGAAAGFHYCKVLSPFRAMEWIYVDALYDHDGIKTQQEENLFLY
jgi:hypothetical protein